MALSAWSDERFPQVRGEAAGLMAQIRISRDDGPAAAEWAERALASPDLSAAAAREAVCNRAIGLNLSGRVREGLASLEGLVPAREDAEPDERYLLWTRGALRMRAADLCGSYADLRVDSMT